jgi:hypothetical protein
MGEQSCRVAAVSALCLSFSLFFLTQTTAVFLTRYHAGNGCKDTKDFLKAANLFGSQTILRQCYAQLKDGDLAYSSVDYGYAWESSLRMLWTGWSDGIRAGFIIAAVSGGVFILLILGSCVGACCGG